MMPRLASKINIRDLMIKLGSAQTAKILRVPLPFWDIPYFPFQNLGYELM